MDNAVASESCIAAQNVPCRNEHAFCSTGTCEMLRLAVTGFNCSSQAWYSIWGDSSGSSTQPLRDLNCSEAVHASCCDTVAIPRCFCALLLSRLKPLESTIHLRHFSGMTPSPPRHSRCPLHLSVTGTRRVQARRLAPVSPVSCSVIVTARRG